MTDSELLPSLIYSYMLHKTQAEDFDLYCEFDLFNRDDINNAVDYLSEKYLIGKDATKPQRYCVRKG